MQIPTWIDYFFGLPNGCMAGPRLGKPKHMLSIKLAEMGGYYLAEPTN